MIRLALAALFAVSPALFADKAEPEDPKAPKARQLDLKDIMVSGEAGGPLRPVKVTTEKDLEGYVGKDGKASILKQANLKKEYLVVFRWAGSGGDKLSMSADGDKVTFTMKRGLTRDLRQHLVIFALPNKATYEMGK
jgi:hypothetical protein